MEKGNDVKVAVLENDVAHMKDDIQELKEDVKKGFEDVNATLRELKERNSVTEFFRENWKVVTIVLAMVIGGNGWEVVKMILPTMLGH